MEEQLRQMKIRNSEDISIALDQQNKSFRGGYENRLQKVNMINDIC